MSLTQENVTESCTDSVHNDTDKERFPSLNTEDNEVFMHNTLPTLHLFLSERVSENVSQASKKLSVNFFHHRSTAYLMSKL